MSYAEQLDETSARVLLVTGCAGFIGSRLCERLLAHGHRVVGVDSLREGPDWELKRWRLGRLVRLPQFCLVQADVRDLEALQQAVGPLGPVDAVLHLAALTGVRQSTCEPCLCAEVNVMGTLNVLELCRRLAIPKLVFSSSSSVYGCNTALPYSEDQMTDSPLSPYAASKKAGEMLCHVYHRLYALDTTVLRYFTVYGPAGRPDMLPFRLVQWISEGRRVTINGDGSQQRDFTYVDDIVAGIAASVDLAGYQIINLGSDRPIEILEAVRVVEALTGKRATLVHRDGNPSDPNCTWAAIGRASSCSAGSRARTSRMAWAGWCSGTRTTAAGPGTSRPRWARRAKA